MFGQNINDLCSKVNCFPDDFSNFSIERQQHLQPAKSSGALFTSWTKELRGELEVEVDDVKISTINFSKLLGATYESMNSDEEPISLPKHRPQNRDSKPSDVARVSIALVTYPSLLRK